MYMIKRMAERTSEIDWKLKTTERHLHTFDKDKCNT